MVRLREAASCFELRETLEVVTRLLFQDYEFLANQQLLENERPRLRELAFLNWDSLWPNAVNR